MFSDCFGVYTVGDKAFSSKALASLHAANNNLEIEWNFHDSVWNNFSQTKLHTLGLVGLNELYRQRAQQLRDTYDYLILNYSGGADSHNILMTFLNNNIHLDEIFVRRSERIDSKIYTPNTEITGAENIFSEWDYVIKPELQKISISHPEIKISIGDPFEINVSDLFNDSMIDNLGQYSGCFEIFRQNTYSKSIDHLSEKGRRVASIYGVDKPIVTIKDNIFFMLFSDMPIQAANNVSKSDCNTELFYYSVDLPQLPFEQAYCLYRYFLINKEKRNLIDYYKINRSDHNRIEMMENLSKALIYDTWDSSKFQAGKPKSVSEVGRSRDIYYNHRELSHIKEVWQYFSRDWFSKLRTSTDILSADKFQQRAYLSKFYQIGTMND